MIFAHCNPCGIYTRHLGPYFLPVDPCAETLYAHHQCIPCGRAELSLARNIEGELVSLQFVEPRRVTHERSANRRNRR